MYLKVVLMTILFHLIMNALLNAKISKIIMIMILSKMRIIKNANAKIYGKEIVMEKWYVLKKSTASGTGSLLAKGGYHSIR